MTRTLVLDRNRRRLAFALPLAALAAQAPRARAQAAGANVVRVGGTGAGLGLVRRVAESGATARFEPQMLPSLGSSGGIKALLAGAADLTVSARPLTDAERARGLNEIEWCHTPFVWAVASTSPVSAISLRELASVYNGTIATWPGGAQVRPILRPENDIDTTLAKAVHADLAVAITAAQQREGMKVAMTDGDAASDIERIPGAIGTTTLSLMVAEGRALKALVLDGIAPSVRNLADGRYLHHKTLYLITAKASTPATDALLQYLKGTPAAALFERYGALGSRRA